MGNQHEEWGQFQKLAAQDDASRVVRAIAGENWAIRPEALQKICLIAERMGDPASYSKEIQGVSREFGEPLENTRSVEMRGDVAIIPISGPLFRYANLFTAMSGATSYQMFAKDFNVALNDDRVRAIVLDCDSPGGMVNGCFETADMIYNARGTKPIHAYVGGECASAAYGLACAADRIIVSSTAIVGSIGVVMTYYDDEDDSTEIVSSNAPKKRLDMKTEEGVSEVQSIADDLESVFIEHIAECRGVEQETVLADFGQGGIFVGEKSIAAGMADGMGSLEFVIAGLTGNKTEVFAVKNTKADGDAPEITAESIAADHPEVAKALRAEGVASVNLDEAKAEGAKAERERIQAVLDKSMPGHEELIESLAFDGETTGEQAAVKVLAAEKGVIQAKADGLKDTKDAPGAVTDPDNDGPAATDEDGWKAEFESKPELQAEFGNVDGYVAYKKAQANGQVKVKGGN